MKMDETVSDLLAVLKDVNRDKVITELNKINENRYNGNISHMYLKEYFRRGSKVSSKVYHEEASAIVKIFPQYSALYIKLLLEALGNLDNRIIVILRLLLKNESEVDEWKILPKHFCAISQAVASSSDDEIEYHDTPKEKSATKLSIATSKSTSVVENSFRDNPGTSRETASQQNLPTLDERPPRKKPKLIRPGAVNSCGTESENIAIQKDTKNPASADNRNQIDEAFPLYAFELIRRMVEVFRDTSPEYIKQTTDLSAQIKQYTTEFDVRNFLRHIPDPETYFNDPNKPSSVLVNGKVHKPSLDYATSFLKNKYPLVKIHAIEHILQKHKYCLIPTVKELDKTEGSMKTKRDSISLETIPVQNVPLVQEIAYLTYKHYILAVRDNSESEEEQTDNVS